MQDQNWDLINGPVAHEIEILNYANLANVIEAYVRFAIHHGGAAKICPNSKLLKELHRSGTLFLLEQPGEYRDIDVVVKNASGVIVHTPPSWDKVPAEMDKFWVELPDTWRDLPAAEAAALCLWKINWIHPFKNGNGRTARAFCYACLCLKAGFILPGSPTVIDLMMNNRDEYDRCLRDADIAFQSRGVPDTSKTSRFLDDLLVVQLSSVRLRNGVTSALSENA